MTHGQPIRAGDIFFRKLSWIVSDGGFSSVKPTKQTRKQSMSDTPTTTIIVANTEKSVPAAFFLTLLFDPLGLLYATVGGGHLHDCRCND